MTAKKDTKLRSGKSKKATKVARPAENPPQGSATPTLHHTFSAEEVQRYQDVMKYPDLLNHSMGRVLGVMRGKGEELPSKDAYDFAFEAFLGLTPHGPAEVMLCQQLIASYEVAMEMLTRCKRAEFMPQMQEHGLMAIKLMGTYERLFQALMKSRRPQQTVRVEHVTINGGQAVVGNVNPAPALGTAADQMAIESAALRVVEGEKLG
ncbi:hypothetical protein [Bradyrhizobium sp. STM 3562]|uniref:hypothetical protein n=1 Tax=Bradyrhizobium sp. STM 3562 TaxID=578924 RepID=UPI0038904BB4